MNTMMRRWPLLLGTFAMAACAFPLPGGPRFGDGTWVGMEPMPGYHDPLNHNKDRWFHQNTLTIKGSEVFLNEIPVVFYKGEKGYSTSDGGFFTYEGTLRLAHGQWRARLLLTDSDYVARRAGPDGRPLPLRPEEFAVTQADDGSLLLDKVIYRKKNVVR